MADLKEHKTFTQQVDLLEKKGFIISDESSCEDFLKIVNYYRLSAYYLPFRKKDKTYFEGITFKRICDIYYFDQKIRALIFSVIETIETYLRTQIAYFHAKKYGPDLSNICNIFHIF